MRVNLKKNKAFLTMQTQLEMLWNWEKPDAYFALQ